MSLKSSFYIRIIIFIILVFVTLSVAIAYSQDPPNRVVHQHITNESQKTFKLITTEIKQHLTNSIRADTNGEVSYENLKNCNAQYSNGDDIITGSGEEDNTISTCYVKFGNHFWEPDNTQIGFYNDGLNTPWPQNSSYNKALDYWRTEVIPNYLRGDLNRSYYYLGRVAHLLEDAAQPSHVHNDPHAGNILQGGFGGDSILEFYTGDNFNQLQNTYNWKGENFGQYDYDNLIEGFNWNLVDSPTSPNKQFIEFFRLFWYTAQKTQYWASDDVNGNFIYKDLNGNTLSWSCSGTGSTNLWADFNYTSCLQIINKSSDLDTASVAVEANAAIPHAMKAVAGLYQLFWDTVHSYDWSTYHHDNRRTGFTLLKGDLSSTKKGMNLVLTGGVTSDALARPSIADVDRNGQREIVISFSRDASYDTQSWLSSIEWNTKKKRSEEKWKKTINTAISAPPTLGNIDSDSVLEVVIGLSNGTLLVIDPDGSKDPPIKWTYVVPEKYSPSNGNNNTGNLAYTAIDDIDVDGTNEIIFADYQFNLPDWNGTLYILNDNGATYTEKANITLIGGPNSTLNGGGAEGAVAIANLDNDDNQEIVVPGLYGIKVYDYNAGSLSLKCNNTNGKIRGAPVIYDIDRDNQYEIIYTTANNTCFNKAFCFNRIYIINASTCTTEKIINLSIYSLVAPAIANLDSDSNLEIVVQGRTTASGNLDKVEAYDANTLTKEWTYPSSGSIAMIDVAPNIADIDGNGNYDIILAKNSSGVLVLKNDGTLLQEFNIEGQIGSSPVIGDLSGKGVAELSVKRAGSPIAVLTTLTGNNSLPILNQIDNLTAIAGELINLNATGQIIATDPDNDNLTYYYSSPFNSSALWLSNASDEGNYSILVEVSDGNLFAYQYVDLKVFSSDTQRQDNFTTSQKAASLQFTQAENKTVQVRLPKNANIVYSRIKLRGAS